MIAVLIDARNPGSSGWVAVRHTRKIRIVGMKVGDQMIIHTDGQDQFASFGGQTDRIKEIDIEDDVTRVKAEILKIGEGSRISIDLE